MQVLCIASTTAQCRRVPAFVFGLLEAIPFHDKVEFLSLSPFPPQILNVHRTELYDDIRAAWELGRVVLEKEMPPLSSPG